MCYKDQMKEKMLFNIIGGDSIVDTSIPIYNSYFLPGISHKERMDKSIDWIRDSTFLNRELGVKKI